VANDRFIELLRSLLHRIESREAAADCLHDIISKGMEPLDKLQLIETLVPVLQSSGILKPLEVKIYVISLFFLCSVDRAS
jgi:exportin-T